MEQRICEGDGCQEKIPTGKRGRPPKYCPECAKDRKRAQDKARPNGGHKERATLPPCCREARRKCDQHLQYTAELNFLAKRGKYKPSQVTPEIDQPEYFGEIDISTKEPWFGGNGAGTKDGQADGLTEVERAEESSADLYGRGVLTEKDIRQSQGYRITSGDRLDSYLIWDRKRTFRPNGTKHGYDAEVEAMTRECLAELDDLAED